MRDLQALLESVDQTSSTSLAHREDIASLGIEMDLRQTIAMERIADALDVIVADVQRGDE